MVTLFLLIIKLLTKNTCEMENFSNFVFNLGK